ncbi:hypothetical protein [Nocardia brasiliensis]|uniref:hypothetical protein n=1 Tax=Nocardia brasiliensis TaxID=37326 RepID=UPI00245509DC|nr:hypothetical protein [Nocardia brasiliensis]
MTDSGGVTVADTVRWLHDEGMLRLAGVGARALNPLIAYAVDVATGTVSAHPDTGGEIGADVATLAADDLPFPVGTSKRLTIVGVTTTESVLVVDLGEVRRIAINGDRPETAARAWAMQLLLNPEISLTTNSADLVIADSPRCKQTFIPGSGSTVLNIDDRHPPVTTVCLNPATDEIDHLDISDNGTGELYLGARFWQLRQIMTIPDDAWTALAGRLQSPQQESSSGESRPSESVSAPFVTPPPVAMPDGKHLESRT